MTKRKTSSCDDPPSASKASRSSSATKTPRAKWDPDTKLALIEEVQKWEGLWKKTSPDYKDSHKKDLQWTEVARGLDKGKTGQECSDQWSGLLNQFRDLVRDHVPTGTGEEEPRPIKWFAYTRMQFVKDHIEFRKTKGIPAVKEDLEILPQTGEDATENSPESSKTIQPNETEGLVIVGHKATRQKSNSADIMGELNAIMSTLKAAMDSPAETTGSERDFGVMIAMRIENMAAHLRLPAKTCLVAALNNFELNNFANIQTETPVASHMVSPFTPTSSTYHKM